jgi:hypothetical protein
MFNQRKKLIQHTYALHATLTNEAHQSARRLRCPSSVGADGDHTSAH